MTATELQRATEPFYTTKEKGQGTGLGLSIVDGFAKQSGGYLEIESSVDAGTVAAMTIPLHVRSEAGRTESEPSTGVSTKPLQGRVLVVDDQQPLREALCRLLGNLGMTPLSASSGADALELLNQSGAPDLLITDLLMPGDLSGQQLAEEVVSRYPDVPVLVISGHTNSVDVDVEFLQKPFTMQDLREAIALAVSRKQPA